VQTHHYYLPSEMIALFDNFDRGGCGRNQANMSNQELEFQMWYFLLALVTHRPGYILACNPDILKPYNFVISPE
jgi:hypothetical protein